MSEATPRRPVALMFQIQKTLARQWMRVLSSSEKDVLNVYAGHINQFGETFIKVETVAGMIGKSIRTVQLANDRLKSFGWLEDVYAVGGRGISPMRRITIPAQVPSPRVRKKPSQPAPLFDNQAGDSTQKGEVFAGSSCSIDQRIHQRNKQQQQQARIAAGAEGEKVEGEEAWLDADFPKLHLADARETAAVTKLLTSYGIAAPFRRELLEKLPGLTVRIVELIHGLYPTARAPALRANLLADAPGEIAEWIDKVELRTKQRSAERRQRARAFDELRQIVMPHQRRKMPPEVLAEIHADSASARERFARERLTVLADGCEFVPAFLSEADASIVDALAAEQWAVVKQRRENRPARRHWRPNKREKRNKPSARRELQEQRKREDEQREGEAAVGAEKAAKLKEFRAGFTDHGLCEAGENAVSGPARSEAHCHATEP